MDFSALGWRDAIWIAVALAALYLLITLLRLARISRRQRKRAVPEAARSGEKAMEQAGKADEVQADWAQSPAQFGEHLLRAGIEAELQQLRGEVASLSDELAKLKAARRVSPQYNEAMLLAQRGMSAQAIADQCGISVGEAELVMALSRNKQEYDNYGKNDTSKAART